MNPWHKYTFVRLLFPYVIGVLYRVYLPFPLVISPLWISTIFFALLAIILILLSFRPKLLPYKFRSFYGLLIFLMMASIAYQQSDKWLDQQTDDFLFDKDHFLLLKVKEAAAERKNTFRIVCQLKSVVGDTTYHLLNSKVLLYLEKDPISRSITYGDYIFTKARLQKIRSPLNPHEFNYQKYLSYHQIDAQIYLKKETFKVIPSSSFSVKNLALEIRNYLFKQLRKGGLREDVLAVAYAILLGSDELLDPELQHQFSAAGAMHILCVSGLHVGVIYLLFNSMLSFLTKFKRGRIFRALIVLNLIWLYALITGLSPSVLRAATMLSFIIVGEILGRKGNVFNSMAASAIVLLMYNPLMIMEVGFQLSYAAVFGIVSLHKPLKSIWFPDNKLLEKFWSIAVISVAAQLATFPIAIYYFHQFPIYFLLSNLMVVFLAAFIINVGFAFFILMKIPIISFLLIKLLGLLILGLNYIVNFVEQLPNSTLTGLVVGISELALIYIIIIAAFGAIKNRLKSGFVVMSFSLLLLILSFSYRNFKLKTDRAMIFYQINNRLAIDFISKQKNVLLMDTLLLKEQQKISYHILNNQIFSGIQKSNNLSSLDVFQDSNLCFYKRGNWIQFYHHRIWIASDSNPIMKADIVVMNDNPKCNLRDAINILEPSVILIYSKNYSSNIKRWVSVAEEKGVDVWVLKEEGAYNLEF